MSIENNLKRIADALEALVAQKAGADVKVNEVVQQVAPAPVAEKPVAPAPQQPVAPQAPAPVPPAPVAEKPVAPQAPAPAAPSMTPEELNNALVVEFRRLGSREAIDQAMAELGVTSVNDLKPEQYNVLLTKVQGIK